MAVAIVINNIDGSPSGDMFVEGVLTPSGTYTTGVGGDVVDFTGVNSVLSRGAGFTGPADSITSQFLKQFQIFSQGGNLAQDYYGTVPAGNSPTGAKFKIRTAGGASELGTGAYPAAVTGDTIGFTATFKKNNS